MRGRPHLTLLQFLAFLLGFGAEVAGASPSWNVQPVESSSPDQGHNSTAVALDPAGDPRIAYYDGTGRDLAYAEKSQGIWSYTIVDTTGDRGRFVSLAIDAAGNPHISYCYYLGTDLLPTGDLVYATRTGGVWTVESVDAVKITGEYTSIALDAQGHPHISYYNNEDGDLKYAFKSGATWTVEPVETTGNVGAYSSLALDSQGLPHIAYVDLTSLRVRYASRSGGVWTAETAAAFVVPAYVSLDLDSQDRPHIAYFDQNVAKTKYATKASGTWTNGVASGLGADISGHFISLKVDSQDIPHMTYFDSPSGMMKYAVKDGNGGSFWVYQTVEANAGWWTSLVLDGNDFPHMSYHIPADEQVHYAVFTDNTSDTIAEGRVAFMSLDAFPNPLRSSTQLVLHTPSTAPVELLVLDARGRIVRNLGARTLAPGATRTTWDGRDDLGQPVPGGVYFAVTRPAGLAAARKIVVVR